MPTVAASSRLRIAAWLPAVVGWTVTSSVTFVFNGSAIEPAVLKVPSLPTHESA
jgi:hypothetical protein